MPRPRKVSDVMRELIARVARSRRELPTDKELARQAGCSRRAIQQIMKQELVRIDPVFHGNREMEATVGKIQADHRERMDPPIAELLVPRPFEPRPRPKTAIISTAAAMKDELVRVSEVSLTTTESRVAECLNELKASR